MRANALQYILNKIEIVDDCWLFQHKSNDRYPGVSNTLVGRHFRAYKAHQLSYLVYKGEYDRAKYICHTCDTPSCVNPQHLFVGTPKENTAAMISKGRRGYTGMKGEMHPKCRLGELEVRFIKCSKGYVADSELAALFNVGKSNINNVRSGLIWKHL